MSIKKLLSIGACVVIVGVSAGASYGLFLRLTEQVAAPALAQTVATTQSVSSDTTAQSQFVAAGVSTQTPPVKSEVPTPVLVLPTGVDQPEPPLLRYASITTDTSASITPSLPLFAYIEDAIVIDARLQTAVLPNKTQNTRSAAKAQSARPAVRDVVVASAPRGTIAPGTSRRFRGQNETRGNAPSGDQDGVFEQSFPPRTALQPAQPRRPTTAASARATQRIDRIRRVWSTGVYR